LPNLKIDEVVKSFSVKTNDQMHLIYVSSLIKSVISLHNLISNKIATKEIEVENSKKEEEARKKKEEDVKKKVEDALKKAEEVNNESKDTKETK
jgi:26S proteasome regulatory subunit N8